MGTEVTEREALGVVLAVHRLIRSLRRGLPNAELPPTHLIVLAVLAEHGPMRLGELAGRVPCSQPTATTVVTCLEPAGLLRREPDPDDGRAVLVTLTDRGLRRIHDMTDGQATLLVHRMREMSEEDRRAVLAAVPLLRRLTEVVSPYEDEVLTEAVPRRR